MLELQIAILLLALGITTLSSLITGQARLYRKLRGDYKPDATLYVTPAADPWLRKFGNPARISSAPITQSTPTPISNPMWNVEIESSTVGLCDESVTLTAKVSETP